MAVKTLQHTRRGLRMVGDQPSLFDMSEPVWHPDEKVGKVSHRAHSPKNEAVAVQCSIFVAIESQV